MNSNYPQNLIPFPKLVLEQVRQWALKSDREICGIIDAHMNVEPLANIAVSRGEFEFNPQEWARSKGKTKCIFHSHINAPGLSLFDHQMAFDLSIPYLVYDRESSSFDYYDPNKIFNLEDRPWNWKRWNCYTFIRDAYQLNYNIHLPMFWMESAHSAMGRGYTKFLDNYESIGFIGVAAELGNLVSGDVLLMSLGTPNPAHFALVLGSDRIFQHTRDNKPTIDPIGIDTMHSTYRILKHREMQR